MNIENTDECRDQSQTTHKYKGSHSKNYSNILQQLEIFHAMSFSSNQSSTPGQERFTAEKSNNLILNMEVKEPNLVESVDLTMEFTKNAEMQGLKDRIYEIRRKFSEIKLKDKLKQGVEMIEERLENVDKKIQKLGDLTRVRIDLAEKCKSSDKGDSLQKMRKPGFTSQFSSCRSNDKSRSPDYTDDKQNSVTQTLFKLNQKTPKSEEESSGRILFQNNSKGKRPSRFLLREFINKNFDPNPSPKTPTQESPFEKKEPVNLQFIKESLNESMPKKRTTTDSKVLEVENLRLQNALDNQIEKTNKLENDIDEGKEGLERLLESMPRKVKQSPLLKMGDKHFKEILELVKFQVDEYKEVIRGYKERDGGEDSDGAKTEDLVRTSAINSGEFNNNSEEDWEWERDRERDRDRDRDRQEGGRTDLNNPISIKYMNNQQDSKGRDIYI